MESFKKKLPILIAVILVLILVLLLVENWTGYRLNKKDGEHYIDLGNKLVPVAALPNWREIESYQTGIRFQSVSEMFYDITVGNFTEDELAALSLLTYHNGEEAGLKILDISNLYEPCLPHTYKRYTVLWERNRYDFYASGIRFELTTEGSCLRSIEELVNFEALSEKRNRVILEKTYDEAKNAEVFIYHESGRNCKSIIYQIEKEDTKLTVEEFYAGEPFEKLQVMYIYGSYEGQFFKISGNRGKDPPSLEWISQFGLKKFEV